MENISSQFSEPIHPISRKKTLLILGVIVGVLLIVGILVIFLLKNKTNPKPTATIIPIPTSIQKQELSKTAPVVTVKQYDNKSKSVVNTSALKTYTLKKNFTDIEVSDFGKKLGLLDIQKEKSQTVLSNTKDKSSRGIMIFNTVTGFFTYQGYGEIKPLSQISTEPSTQAVSFLKDLGLYDETISCGITYKRKTAPETVTFVECHRNWGRLGGPLVSLGGMLNIRETTLLSSMTPGVVGVDDPLDSTVYASSVGGNGRARPNDFNTVTIGMYPSGTLYSINSTMRIVEKTEPVAQQNIISKERALEKLKQNKAQYSLTLPSGSGSPDWKKVYQENKADITTATITDIALGYIERPITSSQESYKPVYIVRGRGRLSTGYNVKFIQTVDAVSNETAAVPQQAVAGITDNSLNIGSFKPGVEPTGGNSGITPSLNPSQNYSIGNCNSSSMFPQSRLTGTKLGGLLSFNVPGYGKLTVTFGFGIHTFMYVSSSFPAPDIETVRDAFYIVLAEQYAITYAKQYPNAKNISQVESELLALVDPKEYLEYLGNASADPMAFAGDRRIDTKFISKKRAEKLAKDAAAILSKAINNNTMKELSSKENLFPGINAFDRFITVPPFKYLYLVLYAPEYARSLAGFECYISGNSPSLFLYSPLTTKTLIQPVSSLTYTDPSLLNSYWNVITQTNSTLTINNQIYPYLYYEYDPKNVVFTESKEGFITKRSEWKKTVQYISSLYGLNTQEEERLIQDVQNELLDVKNSNFLKISIIPQVEIEKQLPLSINPQPESLYRIHLYLSSVYSNQTIKAPFIQPLNRSGFTVLELGAYSKR